MTPQEIKDLAVFYKHSSDPQNQQAHELATACLEILKMDIPLEQNYDDYDNGVNSGRRVMLREVKSIICGNQPEDQQ